MSFVTINFNSKTSKTFKQKKHVPESSRQEELMSHAGSTIGSGNKLRLAVMLPEGEDINEWVASHIVDFNKQLGMVYGTLTHHCTEESCPVMKAGDKYEYHWADGNKVPKPIKCSAPQYISYLMKWVQDQLDDASLFPVNVGVPFPPHFMASAKNILKRLFRVYAHIYRAHFEEVARLGEEPHLNTSLKHFIMFIQEFDLIDKKELAPLQDYIDRLTTIDIINTPSLGGRHLDQALAAKLNIGGVPGNFSQ